MNHQTINYKPRPACTARVSLGYTAAFLLLLLSAYGLAQYITDLGDKQAKAAELEHYRAKLRALNACNAERYAYPRVPTHNTKPRKEVQ